MLASDDRTDLEEPIVKLETVLYIPTHLFPTIIKTAIFVCLPFNKKLLQFCTMILRPVLLVSSVELMEELVHQIPTDKFNLF